MIYGPDKFVVLKLQTKERLFYKVFGTWYGGYSYGDSWRLNSGITGLTQKGPMLEFMGSSGSVYEVHKDTYGTSAYTEGVLQDLLTKINESGKGTATVLEASTDWKELDYK